MAKVYFIPIDSYDRTKEISSAGGRILRRVLKDAKLEFGKKVPLKVHFGEKGNVTYIGAENYDGIIGYLKKKGHEPFYTETNALYSGQRMRRDGAPNTIVSLRSSRPASRAPSPTITPARMIRSALRRRAIRHSL